MRSRAFLWFQSVRPAVRDGVLTVRDTSFGYLCPRRSPQKRQWRSFPSLRKEKGGTVNSVPPLQIKRFRELRDGLRLIPSQKILLSKKRPLRLYAR
jgi:hypothetical protein